MNKKPLEKYFQNLDPLVGYFQAFWKKESKKSTLKKSGL